MHEPQDLEFAVAGSPIPGDCRVSSGRTPHKRRERTTFYATREPWMLAHAAAFQSTTIIPGIVQSAFFHTHGFFPVFF